MKTFALNLQTILFMTELSVLGAYNKHTGILVYNKPLVSLDELDEIKQAVTAMGAEIKDTFQTDNFDVNFYDPNTGGTSNFYEVAQYPKQKLEKRLSNYLISTDGLSLAKQYDLIKNHEDKEQYIDHIEGVCVWERVQYEFTCDDFIKLIEE